jgi:hypothetical protein
MQISGWKKAILGIFATIILGALGSGLWELGLRPGGYWFWHSVLTAATFGSKVLKDQVYLEAAKGNHEGAAQHSMLILCLFLAVGFGILSGVVVSDRLRRNYAKGEVSAMNRNIALLGPKVIGYLEWVILIGGLFQFGASTAGQLKLSAANDAYTYFRQSLDICRPYMTDHQTQLLESRFAALRTRDEYISITNDIKQVAATDNLLLPDFHPW